MINALKQSCNCLLQTADATTTEPIRQNIGYLVCLSEAVDASHFAFLVRVGQDTTCSFLPGDGQDKVFSAFRSDVLPQLG